MIRTSLLFILCLLPILCFSQVVKDKDIFTTVPVIEGKVVFLKESPLREDLSIDANYNILKKWSSVNFGKNPFISNLWYDSDKKEFVAKSKVELLLPPNNNGKREVITMKYSINGFIYYDKCILGISEITFLPENNDLYELPKVVNAENFITNEAIESAENAGLIELKINARKSTLYFLNELSEDLGDYFGHYIK